jgi:hypothetical protein
MRFSTPEKLFDVAPGRNRRYGLAGIISSQLVYIVISGFGNRRPFAGRDVKFAEPPILD